MATRVTRAERHAMAADLAAQERGAALISAHQCATAYVHTTNPDGVPVTFVPGEALPDWAVAQLAAAPATQDPTTGAWTLTPPASPPKDPDA